MSSVVDIANIALSHIGDSATVASLDPPEGSVQAEHCAQFYPIARDALLESHTWKFATRRKRAALLDTESWSWLYAYAQPAGCLKIVAVLADGADPNAEGESYEAEIDDDGSIIILTNVENAIIKFISAVTDTAKFSPLFTTALTWQLASMIAGPVLKGDVGAAEAKRCTGLAQAYLSAAKDSDATQRKTDPTHSVGWIVGR